MTHRNDPAFPLFLESKGLTKRELFAAMAMQAIIAGAVTRGCPSKEWADCHMTTKSIECADALLAALAESSEK